MIGVASFPSEGCYRLVGRHFSPLIPYLFPGKSVLRAVIIWVHKAIKHIRLHSIVTLGNGQDITDGIEEMGFPNSAGAIDGIPILTPPT